MPETVAIEAEPRSTSGSAALRRTLGKDLRAARRAAGLTQIEVCEKAGIGQKHLSDIELGKANPSLNQIHRIAQAIGRGFNLSLLPAATRSPKE